MQGLPFAIVMLLSTIFYKKCGITNSKITFYISLLQLPWVLKPLWAPLVEVIGTKKKWITYVQLLLSLLTLLIVASLSSDNFFLLSLTTFFAMAFASATFDIASDGYYLQALSLESQAFYVGIRNLCYHFARIFAVGGIVMLVGMLGDYFGRNQSWQIGFLLLVVTFIVFAYYHLAMLPEQEQFKVCKKVALSDIIGTFFQIFKEFTKIPRVLTLVGFLLIYNAVEVQIIRISPLFFLDPIKAGGLGLSVMQVGFLIGILDSASVMIGAIIAGFVLAKLTVKRCLVPITILVFLTNFGYLILSYFKLNNLWLIASVVMVVHFGFGVMNSAYMTFLMRIFSAEKFRTSFYAIGTALMAMGMMFFGSFSGYLQHLFSYHGFFIWIVILGMGVLFDTIYTVKTVTTNW